MIACDYHGELDAHTPDDPYYNPDEDLDLPCGYTLAHTGQVTFEYERW